MVNYVVYKFRYTLACYGSVTERNSKNEKDNEYEGLFKTLGWAFLILHSSSCYWGVDIVDVGQRYDFLWFSSI